MNSSDFLIVPELRASVFEAANRIPIRKTTTVKTRAYDGTEWSALHEARFIVGVPATAENLSITEIHYRPAAPSEAEIAAGYDKRSDFEFIEVTNSLGIDVILDGLAFSEGIFTPLTGVVPAGISMLIVSNESAFLARYGNDLKANILATFGNGTNLSDSGERILLVDSGGAPVVSVEYDDSPPWPLAADGGGLSLELGQAGTWHESSKQGGSPGTFGSSPDAPVAISGVEVLRRPDGSPRALELRFTPIPDTATPTVEWSSSLRTWEQVESTVVENNGAPVVEATLPPAAVGGYVRLRFD
jgi:hypothetical protein